MKYLFRSVCLLFLSVAILANAPWAKCEIVSGQIYKLTAQCSGKALNVDGGSTAKGANVNQMPYDGSPAQQWEIVDVGGGVYNLTAQCSGMNLDVYGKSTAEGANVDQWSPSTSSAQKWSIVDVGGGYYQLIAGCSGKALNVEGSSTSNGANVTQRTYTGATGQKWLIEPVSGGGGGTNPPPGTEIPGTPGPLIQTTVDFFPQGSVDVNPPWLHIKGRTYSNNQIPVWMTGRQVYYFKLSQSSTFSSGVIQSGMKRWGFWNPWQRLANGTWYWTYATANTAAGAPAWTNQTYSFTISGSERQPAIPPTPDAFLTAVTNRQPPVYLMYREDIGNLLPTGWPELTAEVTTKAQNNYNANQSMTLTLGDLRVSTGLNDSDFEHQMFDAFLLKQRYVSSLIMGGALLNNSSYLSRGVQKTRDLRAYWDTGSLVNPNTGTRIYMRDLWAPRPTMEDVLEFANSQMTQSEIVDAVNEAFPSDYKGPDGGKYDWWADIWWDQHRVQLLQTLLTRPVVYARYSAIAREELKWAYEVIMYRAPLLSRTDGGSQDGDSYLGVHEQQLTCIPWFIKRLTGYNLYASRPWYTNSAKFMTYLDPFGHTGSEYGDGDFDGANLKIYFEFLARLCPTDAMTKWRFNFYNPGGTSRPDTAKAFAQSVLEKGDQNMMLLTLWKNTTMPSLSGLTPPSAKAMVFRDMGIAEMHTDLANSNNNFQLMFISNPYGAYNHTHPCQNSFNLSFGNEKIFTPTGFYDNDVRGHNLVCYKTSLAHNTIVPNGMMQGFSVSAHGWMRRFGHINNISYALGDATHAYDATHPFVYGSGGRYVSDTTYDGVPINASNGYGPPPGVSKFRRHVAMLRPTVAVIYDELEATNAIPWEFRLHSDTFMKKVGEGFLMGANSKGAASLKLFAIPALTTPNISTTFKYAPGASDVPSYPTHYHGSIKTSGNIQKTRFLSVIQVYPGQTSSYNPPQPTATVNNGMYTVNAGGYTIKAQLDPAQASYLEATKSGEALVASGATATITEGSTTVNASDVLPDIQKYPKMY